MLSSSDRRLFLHLPPVPRNKILGYLQEPSLEAWRFVRDIPVSHGQTLQDVVDLVDICWPGDYPSMILIARASKVAARRHEDLQALEM
jgi:hypothetical protein